MCLTSNSQSINKESIIDLHAQIVAVSSKIESCSVQDVELSVLEIHLVSAAKPQLPLQIEDASRPEKTNVNSSDEIIAIKISFCQKSTSQIIHVIMNDDIIINTCVYAFLQRKFLSRSRILAISKTLDILFSSINVLIFTGSK